MSVDWWWKFERQPGGCLLWTGHVDRAGYGRSKGNGPAEGEVYVHRIVYKLLVGPIPDEPEVRLDVDHDCHNQDPICQHQGDQCLHRRCGEWSHLVLKGHGRNVGDAAAARTHCARGHLLSDDNVRVDPKSGARHCKACNRQRQAQFRKQVADGERKPPPSWLKDGYRDKTRSSTDNKADVKKAL